MKILYMSLEHYCLRKLILHLMHCCVNEIYNLATELSQVPNFEPKRYNVDDSNEYFIHCIINNVKVS